MEHQKAHTEDSVLITRSQNKASPLAMGRSEIIAWLMFGMGILYYSFAYLLRVYPSVMEYDLRSYFGITASGFGLLTSFYYFAYAPMQLPVGVLLDRIGPRRSLICASLVSTLGVLVFAHFKSFGIALSGRFMIGLGAGFAYVTALKLASVWLPRKYFATAAGLVTGCGMVAAIFTDMYLTQAIKTEGFKYALSFPLFVGFIMIALILLFLRDKPKNNVKELSDESSAVTFSQLLEYLVKIIQNPQMWIIGIVGSLLYLPSSVFLDVWGIPYLSHVHHLTPAGAALGVSLMLTGWICSSFCSGAISDIFSTRKIPLIVSCFTATIISALILFNHDLPTSVLYVLLFIFGLCCGPHPLCFTMSKENNPHEISGTAVAFSNFLIMMGGFVFQPIVGNILDWVWDGRIENGIHIYSAHHYTLALSILPVGLLCAGILTFFIRETYHHSQVSDPSEVKEDKPILAKSAR